MIKRHENNPILKPIKDNPWEAHAVFNAGALLLDNKVHLLYRAMDAQDGISSLGYAVSGDGINIEQRFEDPIFTRQSDNDLECYGCEDPRLTEINGTIHINYNSYGFIPGLTFRKYSQFQIAMTSISTYNFINRKWDWAKPHFPLPLTDDKGACILPEKSNGKWVMYHRIFPHIWIAYSDNLRDWYDMKPILQPVNKWEYYKLSTGPVPIKTSRGWLIIYNASDIFLKRSIGFAIADLKDPSMILYRSKIPLLSPETKYEIDGNKPNIVYCNGAVVLDDTLHIYYGAADTCLCLATIKLSELLSF